MEKYEIKVEKYFSVGWVNWLSAHKDFEMPSSGNHLFPGCSLFCAGWREQMHMRENELCFSRVLCIGELFLYWWGWGIAYLHQHLIQ